MSSVSDFTEYSNFDQAEIGFNLILRRKVFPCQMFIQNYFIRNIQIYFHATFRRTSNCQSAPTCFWSIDLLRSDILIEKRTLIIIGLHGVSQQIASFKNKLTLHDINFIFHILFYGPQLCAHELHMGDFYRQSVCERGLLLHFSVKESL